jgi:hypothetical protein
MARLQQNFISFQPRPMRRTVYCFPFVPSKSQGLHALKLEIGMSNEDRKLLLKFKTYFANTA